MLLSIQPTTTMPQNNPTFGKYFHASKNNVYAARIFKEIMSPKTKVTTESFLQKIKRNILYSSEQQEYIKMLNNTAISEQKRELLAASRKQLNHNIFKNIKDNLIRIYVSKV